jgi:hypothetical protein
VKIRSNKEKKEKKNKKFKKTIRRRRSTARGG